MKKIIYFSYYTPTPENLNGPSALPYHLLKNRAEGIGLKMYVLNGNHVDDKSIKRISKDLKSEIVVLNYTLWDKIVKSNKIEHILNRCGKKKVEPITRYELSQSIVREISADCPDLIWIYKQWYLGVAKQFPDYKVLVTGPDCYSLSESRYLRDDFVYKENSAFEHLDLYERSLRMEMGYSVLKNVVCHFVGQTDSDCYNTLNRSTQGIFFPHPHYNLIENNICLQKDVLKIIISGRLNFTTDTDVVRLVNGLTNQPHEIIKRHYEFFFLGKGWEPVVSILKNFGYCVSHKDWVDSYIDTLKEFDIQIVPVSMGTGTKGKALDTLSSGLLCIGSKYALENIAVVPNEDCVLYKSASDIPGVLEDIVNRPSVYELMANNGKKKIRDKHNPSQITQMILDYCFEGVYSVPVSDYLHIDLK